MIKWITNLFRPTVSLASEDGPGSDTGQNPAEPKPTSATSEQVFVPKYLTAVYIRLRNKPTDPAILVRHGYKNIQSITDDKVRQEMAEKLLKEAAGSTTWKRSNSPTQWRREEDFDIFNFDSPNLIFIIVDNEDLEFDERKNNGKKRNLVRFAEFLAEPNSATIQYKKAEDNHAFVNIDTIPTLTVYSDGAAGHFPRKKLIRLENWFTSKGGSSLSNKQLMYSMNIHLLATGNGGQKIPIVIDPDTGNGWGNNP
ncbi:MAG: hypothetical protein V3V15_09720 [Sphingorhabdus sp.]